MGALISESVNKKLDEIVTLCFTGNRICDRAMSVLDVKFVLSNTALILHDKLAHLFPKLADTVSEFQASRNCLTVYGMTPLDDTDYASPQLFFVRILEFMQDLESLCSDAREMATEDRDYPTVTFIDDFIENIIPVTKQCLLLVDKGNAYGGQWMRFDNNINKFILLGNFIDGEWED